MAVLLLSYTDIHPPHSQLHLLPESTRPMPLLGAAARARCSPPLLPRRLRLPRRRNTSARCQPPNHSPHHGLHGLHRPLRGAGAPPPWLPRARRGVGPERFRGRNSPEYVTDPGTLLANLSTHGPVHAAVCCLASRGGCMQDSWRVDYYATLHAPQAACGLGATHFVLLFAIDIRGRRRAPRRRGPLLRLGARPLVGFFPPGRTATTGAMVDQERNCEDILMNFVAAKFGAGPVFVEAVGIRD